MVIPEKFSECRLELPQEPDIILEIMPDVLNAIQEHGNPFDSHSKGKTSVFVTVDVAGFQHVGIDHAATQYLKPACILANVATFAVADGTAHVHLRRRFGEREE